MEALVSPTLLIIGTVLALLLIVGAIALGLWMVGSRVNHIAATLNEKIAPGAVAVGGHLTEMTAAASGLRRALTRLKAATSKG
jgi:hypothetical protein